MRSVQRSTPTTPRAGKDQIATPLGISGLTLATPSHLSPGRAAFIVDDHYPSQPGYESQPTSSRWPVSDDRFDNNARSPRITKASPQPNFVSLTEDKLAWQGAPQVGTLRGGKTFTFRPHDRGSVFEKRPDFSVPLHQCTTAFARTAVQTTDFGPLYNRPITDRIDRLIPDLHELNGRPRAFFPAATTLDLGVFHKPPRVTAASIARLHEGRRLGDEPEIGPMWSGKCV